MRDPNRIDLILGLLERHWKRYPDQRFLQIIHHGFPWGPTSDHYNTEDWQVIDYFQRLVQEEDK